MFHSTLTPRLFVLITILLAACSPSQTAATQETNLPNPASVYCEQQGGRLEMRSDASGGVAGICVFTDGSECDEWAYFRGECKPGESLATPGTTTLPEAGFASDGCRIYENETLWYSFHYPADAEIIANDEPLKSITISGPLVNEEYWPQITIAHPADREEYRLAEGADLETWVSEHNLMAEPRVEDVQIAGTTAIHTRHERSPQSYAYDRYLFAHAGQIYTIVIGHAGDKEDWTLYDHFLESFQFAQ